MTSEEILKVRSAIRSVMQAADFTHYDENGFSYPGFNKKEDAFACARLLQEETGRKFLVHEEGDIFFVN